LGAKREAYRIMMVIDGHRWSQVVTGGSHRWSQLFVSGLVRWDFGRVSNTGRCPLFPSWIQDGCKATTGGNGSEQRTQIQNGGWGGLTFILLTVNSWAQVRSAFQQKQLLSTFYKMS
jgi:hypothetical protein